MPSDLPWQSYSLLLPTLLLGQQYFRNIKNKKNNQPPQPQYSLAAVLGILCVCLYSMVPCWRLLFGVVWLLSWHQWVTDLIEAIIHATTNNSNDNKTINSEAYYVLWLHFPTFFSISISLQLCFGFFLAVWNISLLAFICKLTSFIEASIE